MKEADGQPERVWRFLFLEALVPHVWTTFNGPVHGVIRWCIWGDV
jgi:hypothetical protein